MNFKVSAYGDKSVLIELDSGKPIKYLEQIQKLFPEANVRVGLQSLVITFPEIADYFERVESACVDLTPAELQGMGKEIAIDVDYTGEDLKSASALLGMTASELIKVHQETIWEVALIGFAPGFPYLVPLNETRLDNLPRLETPRERVPAGAVAIAAGMSCVYPSAMPGGWQLIGTTTAKLFDATNNKNPSLLSAGDIVRFRESK